MKELYIIGGTMGVGKTHTCQLMKKRMPNCVFLDGDWCWDMHPFAVTEETKAMVMENIAFLLNNFIKCSQYETILFCWVLHQQSIIEDLLSRLDLTDCRVHLISLTCNEQALRTRLGADVAAGIRSEDVIERSVQRLPLYRLLDTKKVDVSTRTAEEAADYMIRCC